MTTDDENLPVRVPPIPPETVPLPESWPAYVKTTVLHTMALVRFGMTHVRSWCADSPLTRVRLTAKVEQLEAELALLKEELRIKNARMSRVSPRERPHYPPPERLAILQLRAARGWTLDVTAKRFMITVTTLVSWNKRAADDESSLVQIPVPVNRFRNSSITSRSG